MASTEPVRWERLKALLPDAAALDGAERLAFLDRLDDPDLRADLEALLVAHDEAEAADRFEEPAFGADVRPDALDTHIGPYRLSEEVGRGGMGAVYRAERADGAFEQTVALKLLPPGLASAGSAERFRAERQILARLEHPHVARLLDGGVTDAGTLGREMPWLAMEFVDGKTLTAYAEQARLSVEARVRLFLQVCEAVAYAHHNLVVHRDLKPSNILVAEDERGAPQVKLLDFGIAKLIEEEDPSEALTRTGMRVMTPEYAAPEQVRGETVTTATDVYALGVLLYELLTGTRPYDVTGLSPSDIERTICDTAPTRPSASVQPAEYDADLSAAQRLRGDLDTIILKALAKEPGQRYLGADALADDLRRHLNGLPVTARPATAGYRARKFIERHRVGTAAAALVVLALLAGAGLALWQAQIARTEAAKAETVNSFLLDMLAAPDPYEDGREVRVVDVLDRTEARIADQLRDEPAVEAAVRHTLGVTYRELGLYDEAGPQFRRALTLREQLYGARHVDVAETQGGLAKTLQQNGDFEAADSLFRLALATDRALFGERDTRTAARLSDLGVLLWENGDYEGAEPLLRQSLALEEDLRGPDHDEVALSLGNLATLLADLGQSDEAEPLYRRQLAIFRANHGDDHPSVPQALSNLGILRDDLGDHDEAVALHEEALALYRALKGDEHYDVAYAMNNLASAKAELGLYDEAAALQQDALTRAEATFGPTHPNVGIQLNNMALLRRQQGNIDEAERLYRRAIETWRAGLPPGHPYLAFGLQNMAVLLLRQERNREAVPLAREAHDIRAALLPSDSPDRANTASILGDALGRLGQDAEAESLLVASYRVVQESLGDDHAFTEAALDRLVDFFTSRGRVIEAEALSEEE